jgi:hypothetical protein
VIENWNGQNLANFELAVETLAQRLKDYVGGDIEIEFLDQAKPVSEK